MTATLSTEPLQVFVPFCGQNYHDTSGAGLPLSLVECNGRYLLGLWFILLQCLVWIVAAVLTQYLYETQHFNSPFIMSYIGMSMLALLLPLRSMTDELGITTTTTTPNKNSSNGSSDNAMMGIDTVTSMDTIDVQLASAHTCTDYVHVASYGTKQLIDDNRPSTTKIPKLWPHKKHFLAALWLAPAMFCADWAFNTSLSLTSVASATILVSTQCIFVFLLAVLAKLETFSVLKLAGVILSIAGTALTALNDAKSEQNEEDNDDDDQNENTTTSMSHALTGDILACMAALAYAVYTIQVRVFCPQDEELYSMQLLLGYIGIVCMVPLFPFAAYIGWAVVGDRLSWFIVGIIAIKGLMDFCITDYCLFRAIILTNPTIATVGLGLTIPMAFLADWLLGKGGIDSVYSLLGAISVSIGFLIVNLAPEIKQEETEKSEKFEPYKAESQDGGFTRNSIKEAFV